MKFTIEIEAKTQPDIIQLLDVLRYSFKQDNPYDRKEVKGAVAFISCDQETRNAYSYAFNAQSVPWTY